MLLAPFKGYIIAAAVAVLATGLAASHWKAYHMGKVKVQAEWTAEKLEVAKQSLKLTEQATRDTATLQLEAENLKKAKNAKIKQLDSDLSAALDSLRNRPERPGAGNLPQAAGTGGSQSGCTGAGLYRPDGEFLSRYARDTAELQAGLKLCYAQYKAARSKVNLP